MRRTRPRAAGRVPIARGGARLAPGGRVPAPSLPPEPKILYFPGPTSAPSDPEPNPEPDPPKSRTTPKAVFRASDQAAMRVIEPPSFSAHDRGVPSSASVDATLQREPAPPPAVF